MKIYVATKFQEKEKALGIIKELKELGHEISCDWTTHKSIKPYQNNQELAKRYSQEDINGVLNCDIFILIIDDELGGGMNIELGAAIASNLKSGKPKIYVIGKYEKSMFAFHPSVKIRNSVKKVISEIEKHKEQI